MNKQNAFRRGFTLIELMIVIVILGILMGTILPRLTGAQSRARDTARTADLNNISQALEVYSSDSGQYPAALCTTCTDPNGGTLGNNCLSDTATGATDTYALLKTYMKGNRVPQNVGKVTDSNGCIGSYYYAPLTEGGSANQSYMLMSDLETWQMANLDLANTTIAALVTAGFPGTTESNVIIDEIGKLTVKPAVEKNSVFVVIP